MYEPDNQDNFVITRSQNCQIMNLQFLTSYSAKSVKISRFSVV